MRSGVRSISRARETERARGGGVRKKEMVAPPARLIRGSSRCSEKLRLIFTHFHGGNAPGESSAEWERRREPEREGERNRFVGTQSQKRFKTGREAGNIFFCFASRARARLFHPPSWFFLSHLIKRVTLLCFFLCESGRRYGYEIYGEQKVLICSCGGNRVFFSLDDFYRYYFWKFFSREYSSLLLNFMAGSDTKIFSIFSKKFVVLIVRVIWLFKNIV